MAINERISRNKGEPMVAFDMEELTVGSATAAGLAATFVLTTGTFNPGSKGNADRAIIQVSGGSIRYTYDGSTVPTTAAGHTADDDDVFAIDGLNNIIQFHAVRESDTAGATQPKLIVTYERFDRSDHT